MITWGAFAIASPDLAAKGRELLYRTGHGTEQATVKRSS